MATLFTAIASYIGTSIDYVLVLVILFAQIKHQGKGKIRQVVLGQYVGLSFLLLVSILGAYGLTFIREEWVGFLGLVPILIGLNVAIRGEDEEAEEALEETLTKHSSLFWGVVFLIISLGGDNLGVYTPLFTSFSVSELILTIGIYFILAAGLLYGTYKIAAVDEVEEWVEKYERIIVPVVFIGLGLLIIYENGTVPFILSAFS